MTHVESVKSEIAGAGAEVAYIAAEKRAVVFKPEKFLEKHPISYPFLLDEDRSVTKAYGLYTGLGSTRSTSRIRQRG